jgi:hypothetical protein
MNKGNLKKKRKTKDTHTQKKKTNVKVYQNLPFFKRSSLLVRFLNSVYHAHMALVI